MEREYFLLEDKKKEIQNGFKIQNGWLKIYEYVSNEDDSVGVYCCLVKNSHFQNHSENYSWPISRGSEGKPVVYGDKSYKTYIDDGLEPFIFHKSFLMQNKTVSYIDIAEEFVLYFGLYEDGIDKSNRTFYYVNDYGELDEVIKVESNLIRIKLSYLREYITIRDMHFIICYDYMKLLDILPPQWNIKSQEKLCKDTNYIYSHLIRSVTEKMQSWIIGKVFICPNKEKKTHFDIENHTDQDFITGYNDEGELIYENCGGESVFKLTFFKKEVLDKYYNNPTKYKVDGFKISSDFFTLKIDNNVRDYVPVFLNELRMLSPSEQLHWKQYNIPRTDKMGISNSYYQTMIEGRWANTPETTDLFFKYKYRDFNAKWERKFGWKLYKDLSEKDEYLFNSLHLITTNNIKSFCEQTLIIVKLTIDRLNEKELSKNLSDSNIKGIGKFEKFLEVQGHSKPQMFLFLRNLQNLRSGLIAHSFSESNKDCKKAISYFGITDDNLIFVLEDILTKSVFTFNTLEKLFSLDELE